jgi:aminoglycoside/choline kinase family phosphotransferase
VDTLEDRDRGLLSALVQRRWGDAPRSIVRIPAGLGSRRFYRIERGPAADPTSLIARIEAEASPPPIAPDEPPAWLPEPRLEPLRGFLERAGLPVPRSYLHEPALGVDLLEDCGSTTLRDALVARREALYAEACDLVPRLQRLRADPREIPAFGRVFDAALVRTKAWKWLHWAIPGLLGRPATPRERAEVESGFETIARGLAHAPRRLAHRDFKAENLHLVDRRGDRTHLVMIDVQGAFLAPPEYDLVSLLCDLQVELPESSIDAHFARVRPALPDAPAPEEAARRFDAIRLVRLCKDVSHVVRAGVARGDRRRWGEIPRGLALIEGAAERLRSSFPELRALPNVIQALTQEARKSDIRPGGSNP